MSDKIKVCQYIPHGAIPDARGFAPAIVAQNYAKTINKEKIDMFYISNKELVEIYQMSDITVLLSKAEPQGMTMVESIS